MLFNSNYVRCYNVYLAKNHSVNNTTALNETLIGEKDVIRCLMWYTIILQNASPMYLHIDNFCHLFSVPESHLILISLPMNNSNVFPELSCFWSDIFGKFVQTAGPYLYPCKIQYSLICAGTCITSLKLLNVFVTFGILTMINIFENSCY